MYFFVTHSYGITNYDLFLSLKIVFIVATSNATLCCISTGSSLIAKVPHTVSRDRGGAGSSRTVDIALCP